MAKKYRDNLDYQLRHLEHVLKQSRRGEMTRDTRRASGEITTDPRTGIKYKVVG